MSTMLIRTLLAGLLALSFVPPSAAVLAQDATPEPASANINIIEPEIYIEDASGAEENLRRPSLLNANQRLRTDATGQALVTWFFDGTETMVGPNTILALHALTGEPGGDFYLETELVTGHIAAGIGDVAAASAGEWLFRTPDFTIRPVQGQFELTVADGVTHLVVTDGRVEIAPDAGGETRTVEAGEFVTSERGTADILPITDDGLEPNLAGACTATANTNLNVRLAPNEDSRRIGGLRAGQTVWVRGITEGALWLQVYVEHETDEANRPSYGWIYGPATELNDDACQNVLRTALDAQIYGGPGIAEVAEQIGGDQDDAGEAPEPEPTPSPTGAAGDNAGDSAN